MLIAPRLTNDGAGGSYYWDVRGRLGEIARGSATWIFYYGPDNQRVYKSANGIATTYLLNGSQVVTDTIGSTANQTLYGGGRALARNGEFFLPNHLDSTTDLTSSGGSLSQGYQYDPFGNLLNSPTDSNPFEYAGMQSDGSGLLYDQARCYNPAWGRFLSSDPAGFGGGVNPFIYAGDNPVSATDPGGLCPLRRGGVMTTLGNLGRQKPVQIVVKFIEGIGGAAVSYQQPTGDTTPVDVNTPIRLVPGPRPYYLPPTPAFRRSKAGRRGRANALRSS